MKEIWKDIPNYEGLYQASNFGRIKSMSRIIHRIKFGDFISKEKILKQNKCGKYYSVSLCKNSKIKKFYVHRIIGKLFLSNDNNFSDINHKDGDTFNNNVNNLEWCDRSYNIYHSYNILNRKKNIEVLRKNSENRKRKVNQYDFNGNFIKKWNSIKEAEKFLNVKSGKICECCRKNPYRKSAYGYKWEYTD